MNEPEKPEDKPADRWSQKEELAKTMKIFKGVAYELPQIDKSPNRGCGWMKR